MSFVDSTKLNISKKNEAKCLILFCVFNSFLLCFWNLTFLAESVFSFFFSWPLSFFFIFSLSLSWSKACFQTFTYVSSTFKILANQTKITSRINHELAIRGFWRDCFCESHINAKSLRVKGTNKLLQHNKKSGEKDVKPKDVKPNMSF